MHEGCGQVEIFIMIYMHSWEQGCVDRLLCIGLVIR